MFMGKFVVLLIACVAFVDSQTYDPDRWWKSANIYQVSPVSFQDDRNNGYGDIRGIISKLDYIVETGFDVLFVSPFYKTEFVDFGYDISDHIDVDPRFGTLQDVEELFRQAKLKGLKIILDFVPNHTSDHHDWFTLSQNRTRGYENFYVWHDGLRAGPGLRPLPPNGWQSIYGGSSWTWVEARQAYYYHAFSKEQPDLNLREERVVLQLERILEFWLQKGADGFRIDAVSQLFEDPSFRDEMDPANHNNLPQTYQLVQRFRNFIDTYTTTHGGDTRILVPQVWDSSLDALMNYIQDQNGTQLTQLPTNFMLINKLDRNSKAADYKATIDDYLEALPSGAAANWFLGTHDHSRVASRMGIERIDALTMLLLTLPGVSFTYNGDEIAMVDYHGILWDATTDPWACNSNPIDYADLSRDPQRTPFQWDGTVNAGFNVGAEPWLPVHPNYTINNLDLQMKADNSHYKFYKQLLQLRKNQTLIDGAFESKALSEYVLGFTRSTDDETIAVVLNLGSERLLFNMNDLTDKLGEHAEILLASSSSNYKNGDVRPANAIFLDPYAAVVLRSAAAQVSLSVLAIVMLIVKLFL